MIIRTRLSKPLINKGYIERKRLNEILDENWHKPFHLILAGAGFGKSILSSLWMDRLNVSYSWISLGSDCNDVRVFLNYLSNSIVSQKGSNESELIELSESSELPDLKFLKRAVIAAFERVENPRVFVFDDYHTIQNDDIHSLMDELIKNFPPRHKMIILSRFEPPLKLGRIRAFDQLHLVEMDQLKWLPDEIEDLAVKVFDIDLDQDESKLIYDLSQGWIVPIRLMLKAYSKGSNLEEFKSMTGIKAPDLNEFLLEEVFNFESFVLRESLMLISLFERFSLDMASEIMSVVLGSNSDESFDWEVSQLKAFISRSLFINTMDENKQWFQLHDIVKSFLRSRSGKYISTAKTEQALDVGCRNLESNEFYSEAILLNVNFKRWQKAVDIVERHRHTFINIHRFDVVEQWLNYFPREIINRTPSLILMKIYLHELSSSFEDMKFYFDLLKPLLSDSSLKLENIEELWAEYYCLFLNIELYEGNIESAIECMDQALNLASKKQTYVHGFSICYKSIALVSLNRENEARKMIESEIESLGSSNWILTAQCHVAKTLIEFIKGNLKALEVESSTVLRMTDPVKNHGIRIFANYYMAYSNYMKNNLANIDSFLNESLKVKYRTRPGWVIHLLYLKCLSLVAEYRDIELIECLKEMVDFNSRLMTLDFSNDIRIMQCDIYLNTGDIANAWKISSHIDFDKPGVSHRYFCPRLIQIKLFLFKGGREYISLAGKLISKFETESGIFKNKIVYIQLLGLKAILFAMKNELTRAHEAMMILLKETEKEGIIRLYMDLGETMKKLIFQWEGSELRNQHLDRIISGFELKEEFIRMRKRRIHQQELIEIFKSLSSTEIQILQLMSEGMRNKEIAHYLHYSIGTVKTYVYNIYKKIHAENRTKAVHLFNEFNNSIKSSAD